MTASLPRPFEGIRVLDLTHVLAGPFCTYQLAVLGAETIKIEEPGSGDIARQTGCDRALNRRLMGTGYLTQGGNKRCLTLDLKDPRGQDVLRRLARGADVLVENFRSGAMGALGLGYEDLRVLNPRLIYCSMTGFGQEGPKARDNAYDCVIQAISGLMSTTGWPGGPPVKTGAPVIDYASGLSAAFAVSAALFQRERTGRGQRIDCAMLDAALLLMSASVTACLWSGVAPRPRGNDLEYAGVSAYETQDGVLMLGSFRAGQHRRLWEALGRPDLAALASVAEQEEHRERFATALREVMPTRTAEEWERFLAALHVPAARMRDLGEALALDQVAHRGLLHRFDAGPEVDRPLTVPVAGFRFADGGGPRADTPPRALGADTDAVLAELGLGPDEIAALRRDRVV
jgi:crotonobetainyl-CoA:carnitine CoA-transferase CaiB-like acyl-CoA transferase